MQKFFRYTYNHKSEFLNLDHIKSFQVFYVSENVQLKVRFYFGEKYNEVVEFNTFRELDEKEQEKLIMLYTQNIERFLQAPDDRVLNGDTVFDDCINASGMKEGK